MTAGLVMGDLAAVFLDPADVLRHWIGIDAILAASAAVAIAHATYNAIPVYLGHHGTGGERFETAYRSHLRACTRYVGMAAFGVLTLAAFNTVFLPRPSGDASSALRAILATTAGLMTCDLTTIGLTLIALLRLLGTANQDG